MTAHGQLDMAGGETVDPRIEQAARALWWRDAKRTWGQDGRGEDGESIAKQQAARLWPRVRASYLNAAETALKAAGVL